MVIAGTLKASIHRLKDEVKEVNKHAQALQRRWINSQQELITLQHSNVRSSEQLVQKQTEAAILEQRQHRLGRL